ncbi:MalM family protein [Hahella ganghwensis]|uniref:MalM family protein n=1 Tax=Hahella ganghwensis TaxID=286420 RepID=UPI00037CF24F|nr:MalM family protein [Hahella ganghwensis]
MRYRVATAFTIALMLAGCQSGWKTSDILVVNDTQPVGNASQSLMQAQLCCQSFPDLQYQPLILDQTTVTRLNASSPAYLFDSGKSYVAAFELPRGNRPIDIEISSIASEDQVLSPSALILDSQYQVTRTFSGGDFIYKTADIVHGERLEATLMQVGGFKDERYLIIYTTDQQRMGATTMIHPAKQYAKATNRVPPEIDDPIAQHSAMGVMTLSATQLGKATPAAESLISVPESAYGSAEEQANALIKQSVADGNIEEALRLVEDAEANGSTTARNTFIEAVKKQQ